MKCRLYYGRKGKLKNEMNVDKSIIVAFNEFGVIGNVQWGDGHETDA